MIKWKIYFFFPEGHGGKVPVYGMTDPPRAAERHMSTHPRGREGGSPKPWMSAGAGGGDWASGISSKHRVSTEYQETDTLRCSLLITEVFTKHSN